MLVATWTRRRTTTCFTTTTRPKTFLSYFLSPPVQHSSRSCYNKTIRTRTREQRHHHLTMALTLGSPSLTSVSDQRCTNCRKKVNSSRQNVLQPTEAWTVHVEKWAMASSSNGGKEHTCITLQQTPSAASIPAFFRHCHIQLHGEKMLLVTFTSRPRHPSTHQPNRYQFQLVKRPHSYVTLAPKCHHFSPPKYSAHHPKHLVYLHACMWHELLWFRPIRPIAITIPRIVFHHHHHRHPIPSTWFSLNSLSQSHVSSLHIMPTWLLPHCHRPEHQTQMKCKKVFQPIWSWI